MDYDEIQSKMQKILRQIEDFEDEPDIDKAKTLDRDISILRFVIGEQNFLQLHYFRRAHEQAIRYIDEADRAKQKSKND